ERRASGLPFAYAVGRVGFRRLELQLDWRALIPRPETEGMVDMVLNWTRRVERGTWNVERGARGGGGGGEVADLGAGGGARARARCWWAARRCSPPAACWRSRSTNGARNGYGCSRATPSGPASRSTRTCSAGRGSCWPLPWRKRDRPEGARAGPAAGAERGIQDPGPGEREDAGRRDLQAAARRGRAHRPGYRARRPAEPGTRAPAGRAVRSRAPERPGEFGVSAGSRRASEFRQIDGQGERAHLRRHEAGSREPH